MSDFLAFFIWSKYYNDYLNDKDKAKEHISFTDWLLIKLLHQLKDMKYDIQEIIRKMKENE